MQLQYRLRTCAAILMVLSVVACDEKDPTGPDDSDNEMGSVVQVVAGAEHSCALRSDGRAYCWGRNSSGQLGDGTTTDRAAPVAAATSLTFKALSAGATHTCGISTTDSRAYCWGDNVHGQSGGGGGAQIGVPPTLVGDMSFAMISAGQDHTCGVATNGTAYCWGQAFLGDGPLKVRRPTPVAVSGGPYKAVAAGSNYTCALTTAGAAMCWGTNAGGVLGLGSPDQEIILPSVVAGGHTFTNITAGVNHVCGVASDGTWCWGVNNDGQLGTGSASAFSNIPVRAGGSLAFTQLASGELHTCGVAAGVTYCWGRNSLGQLGTGDVNARLTATAVTPALASVSTSGGHACGLTSTRRVYCWGGNAFGAVGTGSTSARVTAPVEVTVPAP